MFDTNQESWLEDLNRHELKQSKRLASLPVCSECGEPIQQEFAVYIEGRWYCDDCLESMRIGTEGFNDTNEPDYTKDDTDFINFIRKDT